MPHELRMPFGISLGRQRKDPKDLVFLVLADIHIGSAFALFPEDFTLSTGSVANLNVGQRYLLECWEDLQKRIPRRFFGLILNGDCIHGKNQKESAADLTEVDPEWQQRAAFQLLKPIADRAEKVWATKGTPYHSGEVARWEEQLAQRLGAIPDARGHYARDWLEIDKDGVFFDIVHRQSVTIRYGVTPLEREIQFAQMRAAKMGKPPPDIVIRSHVHQYKTLNDDGFLGLSTPSLQLQTPYVKQSIAPNRKFSQILGAVMLAIWPEKKHPETANREDFVDIQLLDYNHPETEREKA